MSDEKKTAGEVLYDHFWEKFVNAGDYPAWAELSPAQQQRYVDMWSIVIAAHEASQWRKPEELPTKQKEMLVHGEVYGVATTEVGWRDDDRWFTKREDARGGPIMFTNVTAWRELPTPPTL